MNFLGIGPGEFFFILIVALLVIGPERLPGFARSIGRGLVRLRNWINTSPDAQLFIQVQNELQTEIEDIRSTLRQEMQSVRAEVESVRGDLNTASRTIDGSLQEAAQASTITNPVATPASIPQAATPNNTPMTATTSATTSAQPTPADVAALIAERQAADTTPPQPVASTAPENSASASDVTTPMTLGDIITTDQASPSATVARSRKPNWAQTTPKDDTLDTTAAPVIAPVNVEQLQNERDQLMTEIQTLRQEIAQVKQLSGTAQSGVSHDAFMMMRIELEQLTRDLKSTRAELASIQQPQTTSSVSHDAFTFMKIEIGQLTQRIEELQKQLLTQQQNSES